MDVNIVSPPSVFLTVSAGTGANPEKDEDVNMKLCNWMFSLCCSGQGFREKRSLVSLFHGCNAFFPDCKNGK